MFCGSCGSAEQYGRYCGECGRIRAQGHEVVSPTVLGSPPASAAGADQNRFANWALGFGIASALFFELLIPPLAAIVLGAIGLDKSLKLAAEGTKKTGQGKSIAGIILGSLYFIILLIGNAIGAF